MCTSRCLILSLLVIQNTAGFAPGRAIRLQQSSAPVRVTLRGSHVDDPEPDDEYNGFDAFCQSRRRILASLPIMTIVTSESAQATTGSIKTTQYAGKTASSTKVKKQAAFEGIVKAREELQQAQKKYLQKKDYDGLRDYLENAENINNFEPNVLAILASKKLE